MMTGYEFGKTFYKFLSENVYWSGFLIVVFRKSRQHPCLSTSDWEAFGFFKSEIDLKKTQKNSCFI